VTSPTVPDPLYVAARRTLLDALVALHDHSKSIIVIGAQAVYLRTGPLDGSIAPFTTDGDLALDPRDLQENPNLEHVLRAAGFAPKVSHAGISMIGAWTRRDRESGMSMDIDVHVPRAATTGGGSRAARLGSQGDRVARISDGLEAALVDYSTMAIGSLDPTDHRVVAANVAGTAALLIAKTHKLADRLIGTHRRLSDKDAGDIYRLMQVSGPSDVARTLQVLLQSDVAKTATEHGIELLTTQFGGRATQGTELAVRNLAGAIDTAQIRTLCVAFVAGILTSLP
jgi:hypothetical protein